MSNYIEGKCKQFRDLNPISLLYQAMCGIAHLHSLGIGKCLKKAAMNVTFNLYPISLISHRVSRRISFVILTWSCDVWLKICLSFKPCILIILLSLSLKKK